MLKASNYENIIKKIREILSSKLKLDSDRIMNAASVRGPDLIKIINETEVTSLSLDDVFIVFELIEDNSIPTTILHENDGTDSAIVHYNLSLKIYGNACHDLLQKILIIFKKENILSELWESGIYIKGVNSKNTPREIINSTVWERQDVDMKIQIRYNIEDYGDEWCNIAFTELNINELL